MSRPKGSKNKVKESVTDVPEYTETSGSVDAEPVMKTIVNPLLGYSMEAINQFVNEVNPKCGRGGCLHNKFEHLVNAVNKLECHKCSCPEFID